YVSASEGIWRLFDFGLQDRSHTIVRLLVHLKGQQQVYFDQTKQIQSVKKAAEAGKHTKLTRHFELCKNNPDHVLIKLWDI
ncbi:12453_t:CDS:1, partial [Gigaspora rosea]